MRGCLVLILGLVLCVPWGQAGVSIVGYDQDPLSVASEDDAVKLVKVALQGSYDVLAKSRREFSIEFVTGPEIGRQFGMNDATAEDTFTIGAYFIRDPGQKNRYVLYVNRDAVRNEVDSAIQAAGAKFTSLPAEEQEQKRVYALRRQALCLVSHEGMHAVQLEKLRIGFGEKGADGFCKRLAADRYDEYESHYAELSLPKLQKGKLPKQFAAKIREDSLAQVNQNYQFLPAKFLILKKGKEVEGKAPFAWPGAVAAKSNFGAFVSELVALGGSSGEPVAAGDASEPAVAGTDDESLAQEDLLGDPGFELPEGRLLTGDRYGQLMAGDPNAGPEGTAAAKRRRAR
ncbi:MAG: hypothetical protein HY814_06755 [Candidatus Riflebacteria bacterium]|nr:hypothetical protein [Candidatus Riflebacteria bacterium]